MGSPSNRMNAKGRTLLHSPGTAHLRDRVLLAEPLSVRLEHDIATIEPSSKVHQGFRWYRCRSKQRDLGIYLSRVLE